MRGVGGVVVMVGGGDRNAVSHTGDEKTTKRWEADDRARDRLKIRRVGKDNQKDTGLWSRPAAKPCFRCTRFSGQKGRGVYH